jgi:hypothetical protein
MGLQSFYPISIINFEVKNLTTRLKKTPEEGTNELFLDIINLKEPVQQLMRSKLAILNGFRPSCN